MITLHNNYYKTYDATHSMGGGLGRYTLGWGTVVTVILSIVKKGDF